MADFTALKSMPEDGSHRYQRQLATALADGLGLEAGLKAAQSNGWEGVVDVLLGKRPGTSRRHVVSSTIVETEHAQFIS